MPSRLMPLPVVARRLSPSSTPAVISPLISFLPSTAPMARATLELAPLEIVRAPPEALALILRSLLARIARVPVVIVLSLPPGTFLILAVSASLIVFFATTIPRLTPPALPPDDRLRETAKPPETLSMLLPPLPRAARASMVVLPVAVKSVML